MWDIVTEYAKIAPTFGSLGIWGVFGLLFVVLVKIAPKWRELGIGKRRGDLDHMGKRIELLEAKIDKMAAEHSAETGLLRHKLSNRTQCLESLLVLLRNGAVDVPKAIDQIEAMHERMKLEEREETVALRSAKVIAATEVIG